jgi:hypothetical protein
MTGVLSTLAKTYQIMLSNCNKSGEKDDSSPIIGRLTVLKAD